LAFDPEVWPTSAACHRGPLSQQSAQRQICSARPPPYIVGCGPRSGSSGSAWVFERRPRSSLTRHRARRLRLEPALPVARESSCRRPSGGGGAPLSVASSVANSRRRSSTLGRPVFGREVQRLAVRFRRSFDRDPDLTVYQRREGGSSGMFVHPSASLVVHLEIGAIHQLPEVRTTFPDHQRLAWAGGNGYRACSPFVLPCPRSKRFPRGPHYHVGRRFALAAPFRPASRTARCVTSLRPPAPPRRSPVVNRSFGSSLPTGPGNSDGPMARQDLDAVRAPPPRRGHFT
jgi:hypothetical protein